MANGRPVTRGTRAAFRSVFALLAGLALLEACATDTRNKSVAAEYYNIGNAYFEIGKYDLAARYFEDSLRLDPSLTKAEYNLALVQIRLKKSAEAQKILEKLLSDDPRNTTVLAALAWALHAEGKDDQALARYKTILEIDAGNKDALYNSALILWKLDKKQDALERFRKLLDIAPDDTDTLYDLGSLLLSMDQPQAAIEYLDRYLQKKPDDADAQLLLAACYERTQNYVQALAAYERMAAINPKDPRAWWGQARLLLTAVEDPDKGMAALQKALELGFHDMDAVRALLATPQLLARDEVVNALKARNMYPQPQPASKDNKPKDPKKK
jgi:tetratricopeptide (TPR) repeat protein